MSFGSLKTPIIIKTMPSILFYLPKKHAVFEITQFNYFSKVLLHSRENVRTPFALLGIAKWVDIFDAENFDK